MLIAAAQIRLFAPWVHSLKEKRTEVKGLIAKIGNKFNVSVAEVGDNDVHQIIALGIAGIAGDTAQGDSILDHVIRFIEANTEAEITNVEREVR